MWTEWLQNVSAESVLLNPWGSRPDAHNLDGFGNILDDIDSCGNPASRSPHASSKSTRNTQKQRDAASNRVANAERESHNETEDKHHEPPKNRIQEPR